MYFIFFHVKHPANNTRVALKASDLLNTNQATGVSLKENTVKQESFNAQFEDEEHQGMSDWEITLINQRDSVEDLWKGEFFWQYEINTLQPNELNECDVALFLRVLKFFITCNYYHHYYYHHYY